MQCSLSAPNFINDPACAQAVEGRHPITDLYSAPETQPNPFTPSAHARGFVPTYLPIFFVLFFSFRSWSFFFDACRKHTITPKHHHTAVVQ